MELSLRLNSIYCFLLLSEGKGQEKKVKEVKFQDDLLCFNSGLMLASMASHSSKLQLQHIIASSLIQKIYFITFLNNLSSDVTTL